MKPPHHQKVHDPVRRSLALGWSALGADLPGTPSSLVAVGWKLSSPIRDEVSDAPDLEDVVARPVGVAEVADTCTGAACLDGGFVCWVPHDHDVPDLVGSEVGVPEDQDGAMAIGCPPS